MLVLAVAASPATLVMWCISGCSYEYFNIDIHAMPTYALLFSLYFLIGSLVQLAYLPLYLICLPVLLCLGILDPNDCDKIGDVRSLVSSLVSSFVS